MKTEKISPDVGSGPGPVGSSVPVDWYAARAAAIARAREQIEIDVYAGDERYERIAEIAKIIAEVWLLPPDASVRINRNDLPAGLVAAVYRELRAEHVMYVLDNMDQVGYRIRRIKTYLRTALYNSVTEIESSVCNEFAATYGHS